MVALCEGDYLDRFNITTYENGWNSSNPESIDVDFDNEDYICNSIVRKPRNL